MSVAEVLWEVLWAVDKNYFFQTHIHKIHSQVVLYAVLHYSHH